MCFPKKILGFLQESSKPKLKDQDDKSKWNKDNHSNRWFLFCNVFVLILIV